MTAFSPIDLDALQLAGIISDNVIDSQDVAEPDRVKAIEWLRKRDLVDSGRLL